MEISLEDPSAPEIVALLTAHLALMRSTSPPESVHALDLEGLRRPEISFWTVRDGDALLGCGALKALGDGHGEIKSMHTAERHRGRGAAARLVRHIVEEARRRAYRRLSLETGSQPAFAPARALYARHGFTLCPPFGDYAPDPNSVFMTLELTGEA